MNFGWAGFIGITAYERFIFYHNDGKKTVVILIQKNYKKKFYSKSYK